MKKQTPTQKFEREVRANILAEREVKAKMFVVVSGREPDSAYHYTRALRITATTHGCHVYFGDTRIHRVELHSDVAKLFERTGLTPAGNPLYTRWEMPLSEWQAVEEKAKATYPFKMWLPVRTIEPIPTP